MHNEFMAFVSDESSYSTAYGWAEKQGFSTASVQQAGPDHLVKYLESNVPPRLLILDVDTAPDAAAVLSKLSGTCGPATKLIAIGTANDVSLYRKLLAAGVSDYLVKPLTAEQLSQAMAQVLRGETGPADNATKSAKIIVMIGVRGGVGVSTLAVNSAWVVSSEMKKCVALVDLDLQYGTTALALDLEPGRGLRDLVGTPQRVDSLMIASSVVSVNDQLFVLSAEESIDESIFIDGSAVTTLMKEMRSDYDYVIVDMPRHLLSSQKRLLASAHEIVLVSEMSLVGIRDTLRMRTTLKSLGCPARITLVSSRVGPQRPAQVDETTFTKGAQAKIDFTMPDDYKIVTAASNSGKSFIAMAPSSPISKMVRALAEYLASEAEDEEEKTKGGFFGWLSGGDKKQDKHHGKED
ncbi:MAG: AAA family ATPase [Alphaproteobacteria bacterium]|nr:AAA family ATPase [Alphaproteobacteria bacterium]